MYAVEVEALVKTYGQTRALDGLDLSMERGSILGVLGPNGAGKTTAVKVLTTLTKPDSGRAVVDGIDVLADPAAVRSRIGLHLGDLHYSDVASTDPADHRAVMRRFLMSPGPAALARTVPMAYVWDDHDYGPNDGDSSSPSRSAVRSNYRDLVPHYQLAVPDEGPINQAFTIGRVRFVVTDSRSERTDDTMLGERQLAWLLEELATASRTHGLVVWGNSVPWIGESTPGGDSWNGYAEERQVIADALAEAGVDNLIMISGDAHMVAIDDGSNTDYSTRQVGGFPLLQAGALDRRGSVKGGPYSSGTFPGGGRFGTLEVVDNGIEIAVTLAGRSWDGDVFVEETFVFAGNPARPSPG
jgi:energy-coupling factor transporter ATP-binding protein EcfA2